MLIKLKSAFKNNRGSSLVFTMVVLIFTLLLLTIIINVYSLMYNFNAIQSTIRNLLDVYVVKYEVAYGDSVKSGSGSFTDTQNGTGVKKSFNKEAFISDMREKLHIDSRNERYYDEGGLKYRISNIKISLVQEQELKAEVTYHVEIPMYFLGKQIIMFNSDATVITRHNQKYENKSIK